MSWQYLKACLYGRAKKGKTTTACTAPKPLLLIDVEEEGTMSVMSLDGVDVFPMSVWDDIDTIFWFLHSGDHEYVTVVVDNLTRLQNLAIRKILGEERTLDATQVSEGMTQPKWGRLAEMMITQIIQFRGLPMHVIFLAQERRRDPEDEEEATVFPEVSPAVRKGLTPAVDMIGRVYVKEVVKRNETGKRVRTFEHRLHIGPHEEWETGFREPVGSSVHLPPTMSNPNLTKIIARIRSATKEN